MRFVRLFFTIAINQKKLFSLQNQLYETQNLIIIPQVKHYNQELLFNSLKQNHIVSQFILEMENLHFYYFILIFY